MPVIRLQDAILEVPVGELVEITCTDPGVKNDIPAWCRINGHSIELMQDQGHLIIVTVRKQHED